MKVQLRSRPATPVLSLRGQEPDNKFSSSLSDLRQWGQRWDQSWISLFINTKTELSLVSCCYVVRYLSHQAQVHFMNFWEISCHLNTFYLYKFTAYEFFFNKYIYVVHHFIIRKITNKSYASNYSSKLKPVVSLHMYFQVTHKSVQCSCEYFW